MTWTRHHGAGWRILEDGRIVLEGGTAYASIALRVTTDDDGAIRTRGEPATARTLLHEYGGHIERAAARFDLPASWVAAMVTIEAGRIPGTLSFDPISIADEDVRQSGLETPLHRYRERPHRISAGLMQTLLSTARLEYHRRDLPFTDLYGPDGTLDLPDLCCPHRSLMLGAAYMRTQADRFGEDPVLLVGAYNAGGVYSTSDNPWRIRTYGYDRIPKFCAYHNDILEVLSC